MTQIPVSYVPLAPVKLVKPNGQVKPYGIGATTASTVGTALLAAQTAAASGDLIECFSDATISSSLGKDGVNWWFAAVTITTTSAGVSVWDDGGAAKSFVVGGHGRFTTSNAIVCDFSHASSDVSITCNSIASLDVALNARPAVQIVSSKLNLFVEKEIESAGYDALVVQGGTLNVTTHDIIAEESVVEASGSGALINIIATNLSANSGEAFDITDTDAEVYATYHSLTANAGFGATAGTQFYQITPDSASVVLTKPQGHKRYFGIGASSDSARGTALSSAISAAASGDLISLWTGTFALSSSISVPSGVSLIGQGYRSTKITLNAASTAVSCGGTNSITGLSISNLHASGVAIGGSATDVTVIDCELAGGFDSANPSGSGPWQFIGCFFSDFTFDGMNTTATSTIIMNCTCIASPTSASESSFVNAPSGNVLVANCDVNLSRASNEGALSFIRCGTAGSGVFTSKNNRVRINAGTQAAYGFSTFSFGICTFYSYDDQIDLTGSVSSYHFKAAIGGTTFNYRGGNVSSHNGTGTVNVLSQGGISVSTFNGVTPGTTGLALLDDTTASAARDTLGATSGVWQVPAGGTGAGTLTGLVKGNGTSAMTAAVAGTDYLAPAAIGTTVQAYDADLAAIAGLTSAANKGIQFTGSGTAATYDLTTAGKALLDDSDAAAQRTTLGVDQGNAPIIRMSSLGVKTAYGVGSANSTDLGTALASAVSAMSTGDSLIVFGPATYTITASLNPPAGTSLIGIGKPLISASGTSDATIIVDNNDILVRGFSISTNLLGVGKLTATPLNISGIVIDSVDVAITSTNGSGIQWSQSIGGGSTSHVVSAQIRNCNLVGGSVTGFGIHANLDAASFLQIVDTNTNGETDGILISGDASAEVYIYGGEHLSTLDAVTSGGPTVRVTGARMRGSQADAYSDSGPVYLHGCDHRYTHDAGSQTYDVIGGRSLQLYDQLDVVIPVTMGGTGLATATGVIIGTGTTAMTVKTNPSGAFVGTTDTQTLTNKTLTTPIIASISNTGTLTLPTSTDTLVGRATTDTLTNKTLTSPAISGGTINNAIIGGSTPAAGTFTTVIADTITASNILATENQLQILDATSLAFGNISLDSNEYLFNAAGTPAALKAGLVQIYDTANDLFGNISHNDAEYTFRDYVNALATVNVGPLLATGVQTGTLATSGVVIFNDAGADVDFRVEGDTDTSLFIIDAGTDTVNIGNNSGFFPAKLNFDDVLGPKIALYPTTSTGMYGMGIQASQFQFIVPLSTAVNWAFGTGTSGAITVVNRLSGDTSNHTCFNEQQADIDFRIEGDSLEYMFFCDASAATENIALLTTASPNWQTMDRGLFIGDASTVPTGNPSSGVFLYSESGTLKTRTSGGSIRSLGAEVKSVTFVPFAPTVTVSTGDGKQYFRVPSHLNGANITAVHAFVQTAGTTGTSDIQIARVRSGTPADVLSTKITIDSTETGSDTAATAAVINTSNDDLATGDILRIDVDAVSTTAPIGLVVTIETTL